MAKARKATATSKAVPAEKPSPAAKKPRAARAAAGTKAAAKVKKTPEAKPAGIAKNYVKDRPVCEVTFMLPKEAAPEAESVCILGEFNNWVPDANPLSRLEGGDFTVTLELESGRSYRFRYMIDGWKYENDWFADRYEPNPYGGEDSVVDV